MEIIKKRNRLLGEQVIKNLKSRNIDAYFAQDKEEALKKALEIIPQESSVSWGGSISIESIGLKEVVKKGNYKVLDREKATTLEEKHEIMHQALSSDFFLTSCNAISEEGILVNIDGIANRLAAICYGPKHVLMIVGINKVVKSVEDAISRARNIAAPINAQRFDIDTPCKKTGCCYDCKSPDTICCQLLITRYSKIKGRIILILVDDNIGY